MNVKMPEADDRLNNATETLQIRVHGIDGSVQTFTQRGGSLIGQTLKWFQPTYIFTQKRIQIPGERSLTTFFASQVTRIDLITEPRSNWKLPPDPVEAVELSERAFRSLAQAQQPREKQEASPPRDNAAMVLLDIALAGGQHVFLAQEMAGRPAPQAMQGFDTLFTTTCYSFLMRTGGVAVLNVANLVCFTIYPDPAQVSAVACAAVRPRNNTEPGSPQRESGLPEIGEREAA
jgi:hypothetical protein